VLPCVAVCCSATLSHDLGKKERVRASESESQSARM